MRWRPVIAIKLFKDFAAAIQNYRAQVMRNGTVVGDSLAIESLRRFKDDATEVRDGFECGIGLGSFNDIQEGDNIQVFEIREKKRA